MVTVAFVPPSDPVASWALEDDFPEPTRLYLLTTLREHAYVVCSTAIVIIIGGL
jgi:hypothetical protein